MTEMIELYGKLVAGIKHTWKKARKESTRINRSRLFYWLRIWRTESKHLLRGFLLIKVSKAIPKHFLWRLILWFPILVDEYVKSLKDFPDLQEKLAASHSESNNENREPLYPEHLAPTRIMSGIKSGKLLQGVFHSSR